MISGLRNGGRMDVSDAIRTRRSVRSYSDEPVSDEALARILEAGRASPSANNRQPWHFIVVKDQGRRTVLSEGRYAKFLKDTPVVIVGCGDKVRSEKWYVIDTTIALENMVIQATSEGLGTCWIGSFSGESVKKLLNVPDNFEVVAMLALGHPKGFSIKDALVGRTRKESTEIVSWEEFGNSRAP